MKRIDPQFQSYMLAKLYFVNRENWQDNKIYYYRQKWDGKTCELELIDPSLVNLFSVVPGITTSEADGQKIFKTTLRAMKKAFAKHEKEITRDQFSAN
ncbi:MAG: hypothetical protein J7539_10810 [Niabella sp.]|nr:hypothetical protein [Niabella sp.]